MRLTDKLKLTLYESNDIPQWIGGGNYKEIGTYNGDMQKIDEAYSSLNTKINETFNKVSYIDNTYLPKGPLVSSYIATGAVTTEKIADNAIINTKIENGAVTALKIAPNSISSEKIINQSITLDKIISGTITNDQLQDHSISAEKIISLINPTPVGSIILFPSGAPNDIDNQFIKISSSGGFFPAISKFEDLVNLNIFPTYPSGSYFIPESKRALVDNSYPSWTNFNRYISSGLQLKVHDSYDGTSYLTGIARTLYNASVGNIFVFYSLISDSNFNIGIPYYLRCVNSKVLISSYWITKFIVYDNYQDAVTFNSNYKNSLVTGEYLNQSKIGLISDGFESSEGGVYFSNFIENTASSATSYIKYKKDY